MSELITLVSTSLNCKTGDVVEIVNKLTIKCYFQQKMRPRVAGQRITGQWVSVPKSPFSEYLIKIMSALKDIAHIMFAVTWNVKCLFV